MSTKPHRPLDPLNAFLLEYWKNREAGLVRPLDEYLLQYPGDETAIRREYIALAATEESGAEESPPPSHAGDRIGPYELLSELGRGGQGVVFLAKDRRLDRRVAIKILTGLAAVHPEVLERFLREARIASRLDHPGICGVLDAGVESGTPFIAMRFIEGETLASRIQSERLASSSSSHLSTFVAFTEAGSTRADPAPARRTRSIAASSTREDLTRRIRIIEDAARALHAAHEAGVVHRDVKPGNLMLTPGGQPVLLDFGLARMDDSEFESLTRTGDFFGTPAYMSPEQLSAGAIRLDRRTDVFSLGACLFEFLTLTRPFEGPTREALYHAIRTEDPPELRRVLRSASRDLSTVVATALEKDRDRRYRTALQFADDLRRVREHEPIAARPAGPYIRLSRWTRRSPALATAVLSTFLALSAGLAFALHSAQKEGRLRSAEETERKRADHNLVEYERFADHQRLSELRAEAENRLWPAVPSLLPALRDWLARAEALRLRLPEHRTALEVLRREAILKTPERAMPAEVSPAEAALSAVETALATASSSPREGDRVTALHEELLERRAELAAFAAADARPESGKADDTYLFPNSPNLQWRHDQLAALVEGIDALLRPDVFQTTVASIEHRVLTAEGVVTRTITAPAKAWSQTLARMRTSLAYRSTDLLPQVGLIPLDFNAQGYAEFLLDGSGEAPSALRITEKTGIILVLLPGGAFLMGSPEEEEGRSPDETLHRVTLAPFFIAKHEVTQGQWLRVMGRNPSYDRPSHTHQYPIEIPPVTLVHPVETVSWFEARDFTRRLGCQLPTESQWEYACRAGSKSAYPWGHEIGRAPITNLFDESGASALSVFGAYPPAPFDDAYALHAPVDAFAPNPFGLHELPGNVAEWCVDGAGAYPPDRLIADSGVRISLDPERRSYRGSSFLSPGAMARSAYRMDTSPETRGRYLGLRAVRPLDR